MAVVSGLKNIMIRSFDKSSEVLHVRCILRRLREDNRDATRPTKYNNNLQCPLVSFWYLGFLSFTITRFRECAQVANAEKYLQRMCKAAVNLSLEYKTRTAVP